MEIEEIWQKVQGVLQESVGGAAFELWFKPVKPLEIKDHSAVLSVPNRFFREWIEDNYPQLFNKALETVLSKQINVVFKVDQPQTSEIAKKDTIMQTRRTRLANKGIHLNPKYTFENFVVGPSNQFAHAAALAVGESLGKTYNPLFIYGDVGLGKTHLISAIGNMVIDRDPNAAVMYVSSEQFTNEVVSAIRHEKMGELKDKYRGLDALLIDDVQFIANKTQTQEEFFHTFNALYERQKQIIISADRPPKELTSITDRLKSRFTMGLIADIQPPSIELKVAILQRKAENQKIFLQDDMAYYLASRIRSNIRELEGCLIKLAANSNLTGNPINIAMAKDVLKDIFVDDFKPISAEHIQKMVCEYFNIKPIDIKAKKRTKEITVPRQVAMYIIKQLTDLSLGDIGKSFGGKDHATVIYACKQVESKIGNDENFGKVVEQLINRIKP
ncbi:MAG: chromosomal replication initiator protein DnaA [Nitrospirae bacterium]|nr:chromosomal replication initiator protein DnaA [Nitrospirota bacterium]MBF0536560.1 chromosomal replication initiator protein DnaA [Nitrospirota bacterium]MBF0618144.1 chromosomal replication initiator protein DnaA [Nitrospirota bacterium]